MLPKIRDGFSKKQETNEEKIVNEISLLPMQRGRAVLMQQINT